MIGTRIALALVFALATLMAGCADAGLAVEADLKSESDPSAVTSVDSDSQDRPEGWGVETHSNDAEPNYAVVFPEDQVQEIKITIAPEDWEAMQANMIDLFGDPGSGGAGRNFPGEIERPEGMPPQFGEEGPPEGFAPPEGGRPLPEEGRLPEGGDPPEGADAPPGGRPGRGPMGGGDMTPENPTWVPATIEFQGTTWTQVGVRYKGNSSLTSGWRSGSLKLPLKLDFDEFEDEYSEITDQRFYGFKQLSLANGFHDTSFMRDAATAAVLEEAGLPAAETAFYQVVLDYGEGPVTLGLYTMIEVIDDTVIDQYFGDDDGNIYEAEGSAASFAASTRDQIESSFEKENNREEADWSDIDTLFEVLHDDQRIDDPAAWRANLEAVFDVDSFLEWLAIGAVIQNWDAYGAMSHNYYLYNDPETGQLTWISWDHNEAMSSNTGGAGGRGPGNRSVSLDKEDVGDNWPLIRFLLDDPVYYERYLDFLAETVAGPFDPDAMAERYEGMADLIAPYASAEVGKDAFESAVQELIDHAYRRSEAVASFLSSVGR
jgi:hypothetical protein